MLTRSEDWSGALAVMAVTVALVVLDISVASVRQFWARHSFTSSVVAGVLVVFMTVLIVDRVARVRQLRNQSRAIAAQAAIIVAQAKRAVDALTRASSADEARDQASDELRTYAQMLLISAPVLIDAVAPRAFLESAQQFAAQLFRALRDVADGKPAPTEPVLGDAVAQLQRSAAPLLAALNREQRTAVSSAQLDSV